MGNDRSHDWTRRAALRGLGAGGACLALSAGAARGEAPPETTSVRVLVDPGVPVLCYAPQYLVDEFLRLEGFDEVTFSGYGGAVSESQALTEARADVSAGLGSDYIAAIDRGDPITVVAGLHAGCVEVFASDRVASLRDLAGKRIVVTGEGGAEHVFLSAVAAYVGIDPAREIDWVAEIDYGKWPELLKTGRVDVVNAFPPQNLVLREARAGHVILNTTTDEPWRNFFCCMLGVRRDFARSNPIATKRIVRAFVKASEFCESDREGAARRLVERGATDRYDYALTTLTEVPYDAWRGFDPRDTLRFFALRLHEAGLVGITPNAILARGADFSFLDEVRRELKL